METMFDRHEEGVPTPLEEHDLNMWNDALALTTDYHTPSCVQLCLTDEELGRVTLS